MEADIRPFRSLLLGLFFVTTGSSMDLSLLFAQWPIVLALLGGLISVKIGIIGTISQWFGLTKCAPYFLLKPLLNPNPAVCKNRHRREHLSVVRPH